MKSISDNVLKFITVLAWLLLLPFYWWMHCSCCTTSVSTGEETTEVLNEKDVKDKVSVDRPSFFFELNQDQPVTGEGAIAFLQQQMGEAPENGLLHIIGYYLADEENPTDYANLGLARAHQTKALLASKMDTTGMTVAGTLLEDGKLIDSSYLTEIGFEYRVSTEKIKEIDDRTLIYFPYNSTSRLQDEEIESYLDQVVERVKESGEVVHLTGHTDSFGDAKSNYRLGLDRARVIRSYLRNRGVGNNQIKVDSKGEVDPIAPNSTKEGRSKNRRTELIIKTE